MHEILYLISYVCISVCNKAVEGSGSKGTSKYVGEGVTYGVFLGTLAVFLHVGTC